MTPAAAIAPITAVEAAVQTSPFVNKLIAVMMIPPMMHDIPQKSWDFFHVVSFFMLHEVRRPIMLLMRSFGIMFPIITSPIPMTAHIRLFMSGEISERFVTFLNAVQRKKYVSTLKTTSMIAAETRHTFLLLLPCGSCLSMTEAVYIIKIPINIVTAGIARASNLLPYPVTLF